MFCPSHFCLFNQIININYKAFNYALFFSLLLFALFKYKFYPQLAVL